MMLGYGKEMAKKATETVIDTVINIVYIKEVPLTEGLGTMEIIGIITLGLAAIAIVATFFVDKLNLRNKVSKLSFKENGIYNEYLKYDCPEVGPQEAILFSSIIENKKKNILANSVKVILESIIKLDINEYDNEEIINGVHLFKWVPSEKTHDAIDISLKANFNFGVICQRMNIFKLITDDNYSSIDLDTHIGETKLYKLKIYGNNYFGDSHIYYKVEYKKQYDGKRTNVEDYINIKEVKNLKEYKKIKKK